MVVSKYLNTRSHIIQPASRLPCSHVVMWAITTKLIPSYFVDSVFILVTFRAHLRAHLHGPQSAKTRHWTTFSGWRGPHPCNQAPTWSLLPTRFSQLEKMGSVCPSQARQFAQCVCFFMHVQCSISLSLYIYIHFPSKPVDWDWIFCLLASLVNMPKTLLAELWQNYKSLV